MYVSVHLPICLSVIAKRKIKLFSKTSSVTEVVSELKLGQQQ